MTAGMAQDDAQASNGRDKLGRFVSGASGNPAGGNVSRHYRNLYAELAAELGGNDTLTAIEGIAQPSVWPYGPRSARAE
jgi:hypothetical protein